MVRRLGGATPLLLVLGAGGLLGMGASVARPSGPNRDTSPKSAAAQLPRTVTYAEHAAEILNRNCVECHRPSQVAPFSLVGYENARKWSPMIAVVTQSRRMPPWKAVPGYGDFHDETRLTDREIAILQRWAEQKAPRGDRRKEPKPPTFASDWALGKPDLILRPAREFRLEAEGKDLYRNFILKTDFKEPVYVTAMDVRPGNPRIVHHVIAFLDGGATARRLERDTNDGQPGYTTFGGPGFIPKGSLGGWAPGLRPRKFDNGVAFRVDPGDTLVMQVHYNRSGKPETDLTQLGLYLSKEPPSNEMQLAWLANPVFRIPPGAKAHEVRLSRRIPNDITLYAVMPHMHLLGRSMTAYVVLPDGTRKPVVKVDDWEFKWQMMYHFREPLKIPAGSRFEISAVYDNSAENPSNPNDPPKAVGWGEETTDEMFLLVAAYTVDSRGRKN